MQWRIASLHAFNHSSQLCFLIEISEPCRALAHERRAKHERQAPGSLKIQNHSSPTFAHTCTPVTHRTDGAEQRVAEVRTPARKRNLGTGWECNEENPETSTRHESE